MEAETISMFKEYMSPNMNYEVKFVDFIDHDYRRKYRVIERIGDIEFAGGMVGDVKKLEAVEEVVSEAEAKQDSAESSQSTSVQA